MSLLVLFFSFHRGQWKNYSSIMFGYLGNSFTALGISSLGGRLARAVVWHFATYLFCACLPSLRFHSDLLVFLCFFDYFFLAVSVCKSWGQHLCLSLVEGWWFVIFRIFKSILFFVNWISLYFFYFL